jgi:hypothetical protein
VILVDRVAVPDDLLDLIRNLAGLTHEAQGGDHEPHVQRLVRPGCPSRGLLVNLKPIVDQPEILSDSHCSSSLILRPASASARS